MKPGPAPSRASATRDPVTWIVVAAVLFTAISALVHARLYRYNVIDDSYISFQFARNLATGHGVVFNPGERVEGYTNFLWVVLLAPFYLLAKATSLDFTRVALVVNAVTALGVVVTLGALGKRIFSGRALPILLCVALTALDGAFQGYAASGMENHLFALFALLALLAHEAAGKHRAPLLGATLAGVCLTRPDGALFVLAWAVHELARLARRDGSAPLAERIREPLRAAAVLGAIGGAYFLWRYTYYGALLPNTFYLKVGDTFAGVPRGLEYTRSFIVDRAYVPALALGAVLFIRRPLTLWILSYLLVHAAYVIYVGGDFYSGHRYYVAQLPLLYLAVAIAIDGAARAAWVRSQLPDGSWRGQPTAAAAAIGLFWIYLFTRFGYERGPYTREVLRSAAVVDNNVRYMRWLLRPRPESASMVLGDIGAAGFLADLRVIDVFGVVDPVIAHQKPPEFGRGKPGHEKRGSRAYLLSKDATFIKWGYINDTSPPPGYYLFTAFPASLDVPGLWVKEDLAGGAIVPGTEIHFDRGSLDGWTREGSAFSGASSSTGGRVVGQAGGYQSSYSAELGDAATGKLVSPEIELVGDLMLLRVGGGRDEEQLRVSLTIDGLRAFSATGHGHDVLGRRVWRIGPHRGKRARIEIVDASSGHLLVDEIAQWRLSPGATMPVIFE